MLWSYVNLSVSLKGVRKNQEWTEYRQLLGHMPKKSRGLILLCVKLFFLFGWKNTPRFLAFCSVTLFES